MYRYKLTDINFNRHRIINKNISSVHIKKNSCIPYMLNPWLRNLNTDFTLKHCLFRFVKPTKNADLNKYNYSGYKIGLVIRSEFSFTDGRM